MSTSCRVLGLGYLDRRLDVVAFPGRVAMRGRPALGLALGQDRDPSMSEYAEVLEPMVTRTVRLPVSTSKLLDEAAAGRGLGPTVLARASSSRPAWPT